MVYKLKDVIQHSAVISLDLKLAAETELQAIEEIDRDYPILDYSFIVFYKDNDEIAWRDRDGCWEFMRDYKHSEWE